MESFIKLEIELTMIKLNMRTCAPAIDFKDWIRTHFFGLHTSLSTHQANIQMTKYHLKLLNQLHNVINEGYIFIRKTFYHSVSIEPKYYRKVFNKSCKFNLISQIFLTEIIQAYRKHHSHVVRTSLFVVFNEALTLLAAKIVFSKKGLLEPIKFKVPPVNQKC